MFSRNSASSRAIPFKKMVKMVEDNPFIPLAFQRDHKGMQGTEYITDEKIINFKKGVWVNAKNKAVQSAEELFYNVSIAKSINDVKKLEGTSVTKQLCNRLLEPFMWHTVIVTSGEEGLQNFFELRCPSYLFDGFKFKSWKDVLEFHKDAPKILEVLSKYSHIEKLSSNNSQAEIHIQAIAEMMWDAMNESTPKKLKAGEWHLPNFGHEWNSDKLSEITKGDLSKRTEARIKISTAHNARISYETLGDNPKIDYEADIKLHDRLLAMEHMSPMEHCARAMSDEEYYGEFSKQEGANNIESGWCRNFKGFIQYRSLVDKS
jgi:hypothetical protein